MSEPNYDELDPGIRRTVRWVRSLGLETTDSGDGVTKLGLGWGEGLEALAFPHVIIDAPKLRCLHIGISLARKLVALGIEMGQIGGDKPWIQCDYDPFLCKGLVTLGGLNDAMLPPDLESDRETSIHLPHERDIAKKAREEACTHYKVMPKFDEEAAKGLDCYEVRKRWPRFYGECPDCKQTGVYYASYMHYLMGDW